MNEVHKMIASSIRDFSKSYIVPNIYEWDESQIFPLELFRELGKMGFMGVLIPESYGGSGLGYSEYVTIIEEISSIDPSIGLSLAAHNSLCTSHIFQYGNEIQKRKFLPKLATGEFLGCWGLTEHAAGSDVLGIQMTAVLDGDTYILNGTKNFITHGISGDIAVVMAKVGEKQNGDAHGISSFIVERGTAGFSSGKKEDKLGMRASETAEMIFDDCRIPKENLLGEIGKGFIQCMEILDGGRISIAALSLGISKGAFRSALSYSKERVQFGNPICFFQGISFKLAEMFTEIEASQLLIHKAILKRESKEESSTFSAIAKMYASEACVKIANEAVQIHGGYGYMKDYPVEKFYRDSKLCTIGEGTTEIQKLMISRNILKN